MGTGQGAPRITRLRNALSSVCFLAIGSKQRNVLRRRPMMSWRPPVRKDNAEQPSSLIGSAKGSRTREARDHYLAVVEEIREYLGRYVQCITISHGREDCSSEFGTRSSGW